MKLTALDLWLIIGCFVTALVQPPASLAADSAQKSRPKIYDESADGARQIADALAIARTNGTHVMVQFGGNWCVWCIKLHNLFETNQTIREVLRTNYGVVLIDYNDRNKHLLTNYHAQHLGLPAIVVLDSAGKYLTTKNSEDLEQGHSHSPEKVLAFLNEWTPKALTPKTLSAISAKQWVQQYLELPDHVNDRVEFERIRERSAEALPFLIEMIQSPPADSRAHEHQRIRAYWALGRLGPAAKRAVPVLAGQMNINTPHNIRGFISETLIKLDAKEAIPALHDAFHSTDPFLQTDAAYTLAHLDPSNEELLLTVLSRLKSPNVLSRRGAALVLRELGPAAKPATPALLEALSDSDETVRQHATNTLARIRANTPK